MGILEGLLMIVMAVSVYTDIRYRKIYNKVIYPAMLLIILIVFWQSGFSGIVLSIKGFFLGMAFLLLPFMLGGIGAGDVKLLGVVGLAKGPYFVFYAFLSTAIVGGVMAVVYLVIQGRLASTIKAILKSIQLFIKTSVWSNIQQGDKSWQYTLPYGVSIAIGTLVTYWVV